MKEISWFDGDIPQLQTMMFKAREALDKSECIIQNKHLVPSTVTQQPCDLSPVFRLLKYLHAQTTARNDTIVGVVNTIHDLFAFQLSSSG